MFIVKWQKHLLQILLATLFLLPSCSYALDSLPIDITFDSSSNGGFNRDDGDDDRLKIKGKKSSKRRFDFGSALKNTDVIVTFDIEWAGGWDDYSGNRDDFEVTITGSAGIDERLENISSNGTKSYEINAKTDSAGKLFIKFYAHSNSSLELIYVDNLKIVSAVPAVPTDLSITSFTDTPDPVDTSADLTYTTVIANSGVLATNVKLSFSLSAGTYKSISSGWSCSGTTSINCTKSADFADGGSETVTLIVTAPSTAQTISANVTLSAAQTDSNTANNSASASTAVQKVYTGVDDICYGATTSAGGFFPKTTSLAINNTSGSNLTDANVVVDTSGFALMSNCSIDNGTLGDGCFIASNYSFGPITMNKAISYDLADRLKSNDANHSVEQVAMFDISSLSNVYATYTKNGKKYRSTLGRCGFKIQESLRDFTLRNPEDTRIVQGDIKLIGNTVLCAKDASGKCYNYTGTKRNNDLDLKYIDVDSDSTTYNSSSAKIEIPSNAKIVWAAIYTQGLLSFKNATESSDILKEPVFIDIPGMTKFSSVPEVVNIYPVYKGYTYATYTPLNSLIGKKGLDINGFMTVANIKAFEGVHSGIGNFGAWTVVLIYEDEAANYKNISVFDGYQYVSSSSKDVTITVEGFLTPKSGDINSTMGLFVGEGDANINGDKLYFEGNAINTKDAFYSSISGVTRNPSYTNNQGIDIQNHDVSSYMTHKQTSASIRLTSTGDFYVPSLITFSTDIYVPEFCYDYAYRQHDIYFTELNDGTKDPRITGSVTTGVP
ncbi:MAG: hypothetical protein IE916_10875, partial [Epsilonproteobacteria bacterium]|nr:hypothetical protein [Campylobacterota bacterium]